MKPARVRKRLAAGWTTRQAFGIDTAPRKPSQHRSTRHDADLVTYDGETLSLSAWARRVGVKRTVLWYRLHEATPPWPVAEALGFAPHAQRQFGPRPMKWKALIETALAVIHGPPERAKGRAA